MDRKKLLDIMKTEIRPAIGCTEPVAVALAAAEAVGLAAGELVRLTVTVDPNIYKNGMGVYVPGTAFKGLAFAAALGAVAGDPALELEVLKNVAEEDIVKARRLIEENRVSVNCLSGHTGIYVEAVAEFTDDVSKVLICERHSNIVLKEKNGVVLLDRRRALDDQPADLSVLQGVTLGELISEVNGFKAEELSFLEYVIAHNRGIAEQGLHNFMGMGTGYKWYRLIEQKLVPEDWVNLAKAYTAGATDARMSGKNLPVMSCAGSGNQGLMASLPIIVAARYFGYSGEKLYKALALSFLVTIYVKAHIGRLSALCGCAIAASAGAGAGLGLLFDLDENGITGIINNLIGDISGMICDGAKPGCSLKLMTAVDAACQMTLLAKEGVVIEPGSGIVAAAAEDSIKNVGLLSKPGMVETDRTILKIMLQGGDCNNKLVG